jgi:methyl-accepting chemotaxis protein
MKQISDKLSLTAKLLGGIGVFLFAVAVFLFIFFPQRQKAETARYVDEKATGISQILANSVAVAMVFEDAGSAQKALGAVQGLPGVVCASAVKPDGVSLAAYQGEKLDGYRALLQQVMASDSACTVHNDDVAMSMVPVRYAGKRAGSLVVVTDLTAMHRDVATSRWITLAVSFVILALGLGLLSILIRKVVIEPVGKVRDALRNADLHLRFDSTMQDEIGQMTRAFDGFVGSLRTTLVQVQGTAQSVASASAQISSSTEEMAAGAQEQTSQASEVAGSVEEIARTIQENSQNAAHAAQVAADARKAAHEGGGVVEGTITGMRRIADVVRQSAQTVRALGTSSDQIGEIISVIDDIADQTNLLALNAAIEAARAGDQGRGFAVVADEVRKLAERTTKATKEIAQMIRKIQGDTRDAVASMEEGTRQVDDGIRLADKAGSSLQSIVGISQQVTDMVSQIAVASEQQASMSQQISRNVEAITTVTSETASGTQQIARSADDLRRVADELQKLMQSFNLEAHSHAGVPEVDRGPHVDIRFQPRPHKAALASRN